ncbi:hypothetical protein D3C84_1056540 [compost metagenome]
MVDSVERSEPKVISSSRTRLRSGWVTSTRGTCSARAGSASNEQRVARKRKPPRNVIHNLVSRPEVESTGGSPQRKAPKVERRDY